MKKIDRTGEHFISNNNLGSYEFVIVKYNNSKDLWVQFQDEYGAIIHTDYGNCKKGRVKNPYHPSLFEMGCLGLMKDGSKPTTTYGNGIQTREYDLWGRMIERCYSNYEYWNTYKDVTVCDRWLVFANFLEDIKYIEGYELWLNHPNERIALDKDIKGNGSKIYSLETCCFVTIEDNVKEIRTRYNEEHFGGDNKIKVYGINIITGERTKDFSSIKQVERELGINHSSIIKCLQGKQKTSCGYKWFKIES